MKFSEKEIEDKLLKLLENSVKIACENEKETGVVFSAGLDSTIIAFLAKKFSNVNAYTVGSENSGDIENAKKLKNKVDFDIKIREINVEEVKKILPSILKIIDKKNDPVQVSCAIPIYFASKEANKDGLKVMLSGQGGDELFAGYNRYLQYTKNYKKLSTVLEEDVKNAYEDNLNRDIAVCAANGIELRLPFMNSELVKFTLKIPAKLKIKEVKDKEFSCIDIFNGKKIVRKYLLRKIAKKIGIPEVVINRSKKALQYGSHSMKMLEKIARESGFRNNTRACLENITKSL